MAPHLILVTGPSGSGKTTLAHRLAATLGCPALSRDEIKEGMVLGLDRPYRPEPGDQLTVAATELFFVLLAHLVTASTTVVAEAAFQDHLWRHRLESIPLSRADSSTRLVVIRCRTDPAVARLRIQTRPTRRAHDDRSVLEDSSYYNDFEELSLPVPTLAVDTTSGYGPDLGAVVRFITG